MLLSTPCVSGRPILGFSYGIGPGEGTLPRATRSSVGVGVQAARTAKRMTMKGCMAGIRILDCVARNVPWAPSKTILDCVSMLPMSFSQDFESVFNLFCDVRTARDSSLRKCYEDKRTGTKIY